MLVKNSRLLRSESEELVITLSPVPDENIEKVVVRASRTRAAETRSIASLDEEAIRREGGKNLADTLAELPGVSVLRSGNVAKPIVRGQHSARLLNALRWRSSRRAGLGHEPWGRD